MIATIRYMEKKDRNATPFQRTKMISAATLVQAVSEVNRIIDKLRDKGAYDFSVVYGNEQS